MLTSISHSQRYLPYLLDNRYHAVKTYRNGAPFDLSAGVKPLSCAGTNDSMARNSP